jgi:hypothetical protein
MAIYKLIANGSFGPDEIEVMTAAYEAALIEVPLANRDDPIGELIAKGIVNVTAGGWVSCAAVRFIQAIRAASS